MLTESNGESMRESQFCLSAKICEKSTNNSDTDEKTIY